MTEDILEKIALFLLTVQISLIVVVILVITDTISIDNKLNGVNSSINNRYSQIEVQLYNLNYKIGRMNNERK